MNIDIIVILACLIFLVLSLSFELLKSTISFLLIICVISLSGILSPNEVLKIIANEQIAVILMLMILGNVLRRSVLLDKLFKSLFKDGDSEKIFLSKLYFSIGTLSAFFNNTPLVAIVIPHVTRWGKRNNISPSKLLIPLSFASIVGGGITLIGTSANLIVNKMYIDNGGEGFHLFDFAIIGIPIFLVSFIFIVFGNKLLSNRISIDESPTDSYLIEARIKNKSSIIGETVSQAGLRDLKNLFLVEIYRHNNDVILASPDLKIEKNDILIFAGDTNKAIDLLETHPSLELNNTSIELEDKQEVIEAVIPYNSNLVGKKVKESNFRAEFDSAIIGVRRNGEKVSGKIGELIIERGDMFLCVTGKNFYSKVNKGNDLYVISKVEELKNIDSKSSYLVLAGMTLAMFLAAFKVTSLFNSMLLILTSLAVTKLVPFGEIRKSFNYNFLLIAGGALVFGDAMNKTGLAEKIAFYCISFFQPLGESASLIGLFLITNILASLMTNIAAIAVVFPIAVVISNSLGIDLFWTSMMIAFGGSKIFLTPIGYQTNLMVFGPGGYKNIDFIKYGGLLLLLVTITIFLTLSFL